MGRGFFRYLYSKLLEEVSRILEDERSIDLSKRCSRVEKKWTRTVHLTVRTLRTAKKNPEEAKRLLLGIAENILLFRGRC